MSVMAFLAFTSCHNMRSNLNIAIIAMVNSSESLKEDTGLSLVTYVVDDSLAKYLAHCDIFNGQ